MKKIMFFFIAVALFAGCSKETSTREGKTLSFKVSCSQAAKVSLNTLGKTVWNAGDEASVFYGGGSDNLKALYKGEDGVAFGELEFTVPSISEAGAGATSVALVPYNPSASISGSVVTSTVPVVQHYCAGSYEKGAAVLASVSDGDEFTFSYVTPVLSVTVGCTSLVPVEISSVTLKSINGEKIAGDIDIDLVDAAHPAVTVKAGGSASIVMKNDNGSSLITLNRNSEKVTFFFAAAPVALYKGYEFEIASKTGETYTVRCTDVKSLVPGILYPVSVNVSKQTPIVIDFSEGNSYFSPVLPTSKKISKASGDVYSFSPDGFKNYNIVVHDTSNGYYWGSSDNVGFLRINSGTVTPYTGWVRLPSIKDMRLVRFGAMVKQNSTKPFALSSTPDGGGDLVSSTTYTTGEMLYSPVKAEVNSELYITDATNNTQIARIELFFE